MTKSVHKCPRPSSRAYVIEAFRLPYPCPEPFYVSHSANHVKTLKKRTLYCTSNVFTRLFDNKSLSILFPCKLRCAWIGFAFPHRAVPDDWNGSRLDCSRLLRHLQNAEIDVKIALAWVVTFRGKCFLKISRNVCEKHLLYIGIKSLAKSGSSRFVGRK